MAVSASSICDANALFNFFLRVFACFVTVKRSGFDEEGVSNVDSIWIRFCMRSPLKQARKSAEMKLYVLPVSSAVAADVRVVRDNRAAVN